MSEANTSPRPARGWRSLARLDWRKPIGVRVSYVHGSDPKIRVQSRGREWLYDWDTALLDVLSDVANRGGWGL